jgi:hypothetical protein
MWDLVEDGICYMDQDALSPTIDFFHFDTGKVSRIAVLEDRQYGLGFSVSPDRRWILYRMSERNTDIMLVENFH